MSRSVYQALLKDIVPRWRIVDFALMRHVVAAFRIGSHSHGTHIPPEDPDGIDDTDYMVIVCPSPAQVMGLRKFEGHVIQEDGVDVVFYEWGKYIRLLLKSNPNVIGTLWLEDEDWWAPEGRDNRHPSIFRMIRDYRGAFMSKRMATAFIGYAEGQLYKMKHHALQGYMGEKRRLLVERFGFDVKNAAHMIRLLRMCCEFLETGTLVVRRPDAVELIEVKRGLWSLERVEAESERLFALARALEKTTTAQEHPAETLAENLMIRGYFETWDFTRSIAMSLMPDLEEKPS